MSQHVAARPDGELPLYWTATCEHCRPRHSLPFSVQNLRNRWTTLHYAATGHTVTHGTMRGRNLYRPTPKKRKPR